RHNSQFQYLPILRSAHSLNECLAVFGNVFDKHLLTTLGRPNQVVHNEVYSVLVVLIFHAPIIADKCRFVSTVYKIGMVSWAETHSSTTHKWAWLSARIG